MKFKKVLSLISAAAISASCFAGLCATASANNITGTVDTIYKAADLCASVSDSAGTIAITDTSAYDALGKPFGEAATITSTNYPKLATDKNAAASVKYNIEESGTYIFSMLLLEYDKRYPVVKLGDEVVLQGDSLSGCTKYGTYDGSRKLTIIQYTAELEKENEYTYSWTAGSANRIQGLLGVVLNKVEESDIPATAIAITASNINTANLILKPTETIQLTSTLTPANATTEVEWSSSNSSVATVENGKVTAVASGTATITAKAGNVSATSEIEVLTSSAPATTTKTVYAKINCTNETVGGNRCDVNTIHKFTVGADEEAKAIFADETYGTVIDNSFLEYYVNYVVGTSSDKTGNVTKPSFNLTIPRGTFKMYLLGRNSGTDNITAAINGTGIGSFTRNADFAIGSDANGDSVKKLDLYVLEFTTTEAMTDAVVTFDTDQQWLPDMYAVAVAGTEYVAPVPQTAPATGETFSDKSGNAAAAYSVALTDITGTITAPKWVITATKVGEEGTGTATVEINNDNTPNFTLANNAGLSFGLVIKDIAEGMTITGASLVYTVE